MAFKRLATAGATALKRPAVATETQPLAKTQKSGNSSSEMDQDEAKGLQQMPLQAWLLLELLEQKGRAAKVISRSSRRSLACMARLSWRGIVAHAWGVACAAYQCFMYTGAVT